MYIRTTVQGEGELWDYVGVDWRKWKAENENDYKSTRGAFTHIMKEKHINVAQSAYCTRTK